VTILYQLSDWTVMDIVLSDCVLPYQKKSVGKKYWLYNASASHL